MLGIDLYAAYNKVTDWRAVAADGVRDVYVKLTDGGGRAGVPGDAYVAGARSVGLRVGGYHYLQVKPSPESQADVFAAELRRLNALDLPPALDLEEPSIPLASRADYGKRFLLHLRATLGRPVALYTSASWWTALRPETWGVPLIAWVAAYGLNDGSEHPVPTGVGHVDAHQYTSAGRVRGITGPVDLDDFSATYGQEGAAMLDSNSQPDATVIAGAESCLPGVAGVRNAGDLYSLCYQIQQQLGAKIAALTAAVSALSGGEVTRDELTTIVDEAVAGHLVITGTVSVTGTTATGQPTGTTGSPS